jgi:hypothetical protein
MRNSHHLHAPLQLKLTIHPAKRSEKKGAQRNRNH